MSLVHRHRLARYTEPVFVSTAPGCTTSYLAAFIMQRADPDDPAWEIVRLYAYMNLLEMEGEQPDIIGLLLARNF